MCVLWCLVSYLDMPDFTNMNKKVRRNILPPNNSSTGARPRVKYPWDEWFQEVPGQFTLYKGRDFTIRAFAMEQQVRNMAAQPYWRLKVSVHVAQDEKSVTVKVLGRME